MDTMKLDTICLCNRLSQNTVVYQEGRMYVHSRERGLFATDHRPPSICRLNELARAGLNCNFFESLAGCGSGLYTVIGRKYTGKKQIRVKLHDLRLIFQCRHLSLIVAWRHTSDWPARGQYINFSESHANCSTR